MSSLNLANIQAELEQERETLVRQLHELGATEAGELRSDLKFEEGYSDQAAATAERTKVLGLVSNLHTKLQAVDQALQQIEQKTYGSCVACGEEISAARLTARPESVYCVSCKSKV